MNTYVYTHRHTYICNNFTKRPEFEREQGGVNGHRGMGWFGGKKGKEEIILFQLK